MGVREIIFKAKRKDNGEWVEGWLLKDGVTGQHFIHASGNSVNESDKVNEEGCLRFVAFEVDENTICQYTGLLDSNGNKIWENDFVKTEKGLIYKIFWHKSFFRLSGSLQDENNHLGSRFWLNLWEIKNIRCKEVIGNCFDNPELLGE